MYIKQLNRGASDQVFVAVQNTGAAVCSVGHCVYWDYGTILTATAQASSGFQVGHDAYATTATRQKPAFLAAGIVAGRDIPVGDYGSVQVYGHCTNLVVTGASDAGAFFPALLTTNRLQASFTNVVLRPICLGNNTVGHATNNGYMAAVSFLTNLAAATNGAAQQLTVREPGPYAIPVDNPNGLGGILTTSSGSIKAFLHFL